MKGDSLQKKRMIKRQKKEFFLEKDRIRMKIKMKI